MTLDGATQGGADSRATFRGRLEAALAGLRAYLAALVPPGGPVEADDVLQETLARALRSRATHDPGRPLGPWLRRTALRTLFDLRAQGARGPAALEAAAEDLAAPCAPDQLALEDELQGLLARLAPVEREVLERFHRRGQSVRAVAQALGLPEGTVKSHLHRARRRLANGEPR